MIAYALVVVLTIIYAGLVICGASEMDRSLTDLMDPDYWEYCKMRMKVWKEETGGGN